MPRLVVAVVLLLAAAPSASASPGVVADTAAGTLRLSDPSAGSTNTVLMGVPGALRVFDTAGNQNTFTAEQGGCGFDPSIRHPFYDTSGALTCPVLPSLIADLGSGNDILALRDTQLLASVLLGPGNDKLRSLENAVRVDADPGFDVIDTGVGNDDIQAGPGTDIVRPGAGDDVLRLSDGERDGSNVQRTVDCGPGLDTIADHDTFDRLLPTCEQVREEWGVSRVLPSELTVRPGGLIDVPIGTTSAPITLQSVLATAPAGGGSGERFAASTTKVAAGRDAVARLRVPDLPRSVLRSRPKLRVALTVDVLTAAGRQRLYRPVIAANGTATAVNRFVLKVPERIRRP